MSFDDYLLGAVACLVLGAIAYALWTGRISFAGDPYLRSERPVEYWRELFLLIVQALILLAWLLFLRVPGDRFPSTGSVLFLVVFAPPVIRAAWTRRILFGGNLFTPSERPGPYWTMQLVGAAMLGFVLYALVTDLRL